MFPIVWESVGGFVSDVLWYDISCPNLFINLQSHYEIELTMSNATYPKISTGKDLISVYANI